MKYVKFGNTGMDVSQLCLGAMGFGDPNSGFHEWGLEEEEIKVVIFGEWCFRLCVYIAD